MLCVGKKEAIVRLRENIEQLPSIVTDTDDEQRWQADEYSLNALFSDALAHSVEENFASWIEKAKNIDYEITATAIRTERNKLLEATDKAMRIDRLGLQPPDGTTFSAWAEFLKGLGNATTGTMAQYSQALRDVPQQEGFPYDVVWPTPVQDGIK